MAVFTMRLYQGLPGSQPLPDMAIDTDVTALQWTHGLPGGPLALTVGVDMFGRDRREYGRGLGYLPDMIDVVPFAHVIILAGTVPVWAGRVMQRTRPAGQTRGFTAVGYGLTGTNDDYYPSASAVSTTSGVILTEVIQSSAPLLSVGNADQFVDPGVAHTRGEFNGMYPSEVIDQLTQEGGAQNVPWDYWVDLNRVVHFKPRMAPDQPDYRIPFDDDVDWDEDYTNVYGSAAVNYALNGTDSTSPVATTAGFPDRYGGVQRTALVRGDELTAVGAAQFRDTWLLTHFDPQIAATVRRRLDRGLERFNGGEIPAHLILQGQWIQVGDETPQIIVGSTFDGLTGDCTIELNQPDPSLPKNFLRLERETVGKVRRLINPVTGGKVR